MPQKNQERTLGVEEELARTIAELRKEKNLTYEDLAERMAAAGCKIHPSGIQKTEKSGRRITVDELVGYSKALDIPLASLVDPTVPKESTAEHMRDYLAAEKMGEALRHTSIQYWGMVEDLQRAVSEDPVLRAQIEERFTATVTFREKMARQNAEASGIKFKNDEEFQEHLWEHWAVPAMKTARDVLEGRTWQR